MKVIVKSPFIDRNGLHKKDEIVEINTAAFNPFNMVKIPEKRAKAVEEIKTESVEETKTEAVADEPTKPVRKSRRRKE